VVRVRAGAVTTAPAVRLDPAGAVTGLLRDAATGAPAPNVDVLVIPFYPDPKYGGYAPMSDETGRFTVSGLGPYHWPLQFSGGGYAAQWSGGVANRLQARTVRVTAGGTATLATQRLVRGTEIRGAITPGTLPTYAGVRAFNTATGDLAGSEAGGDESYALRVLPGQTVKLHCECLDRWYRDATGFDSAVPLRVRSAPIVADFTG
jgi:hypothetical protein